MLYDFSWGFFFFLCTRVGYYHYCYYCVILFLYLSLSSPLIRHSFFCWTEYFFFFFLEEWLIKWWYFLFFWLKWHVYSFWFQFILCLWQCVCKSITNKKLFNTKKERNRTALQHNLYVNLRKFGQWYIPFLKLLTAVNTMDVLRIDWMHLLLQRL